MEEEKANNHQGTPLKSSHDPLVNVISKHELHISGGLQ